MNRHTILRVGGWLLVAAAVVPFLVVAAPQAVGADGSHVVMSSSMAPAIHSGDVVVVREVPPERIERGDVITFYGERTRVTHRVVEVVDREGGLYFRTKGDANEDPDRNLVPARAVAGRVAFTIPLAGHLILFVQSRLGFAALVVAPAVLLVGSELLDLWRLYRDGETPERRADGGDEVPDDEEVGP